MARILYRGMDRAEIDRQLNLRARWPEHVEFFARWAHESAALRDRLEGRLDLAYGTSPGERLDLFLPRAARPAALLAFIHGGYWQSLDKSDFSYLAPPFLKAGIAFASLNYDLAPRASIAEMVSQVRKAIAWLARHGPEHGVDSRRIYVAGHSAGGHLAIMALLTDWSRLAGSSGGTLSPGLVKGACSISGIYELEPVQLSYHQDILKLDPAAVAALSPLRLVPARAAPLILAVGTEETEEFLYQQDALLTAWQARGLGARAVALPGRHHFSAVDALGEADHPLCAAVRELVRSGRASA